MLDFYVLEDGILRLHGHLCVLNDINMRNEILLEAHHSNYNVFFWLSSNYNVHLHQNYL